MPAPFQIKICGITTVEDALQAVDAGADALGFNFFEGSARCIHLKEIGQIARALIDRNLKANRVGVCVNASLPKVHAYSYHGQLGAIQLHGDEEPSVVGEVQRLSSSGVYPVIRAFRVKSSSLDSVREYLAACGTELPEAVLLDAYDPTAYGGTGKRLDWDLVRRERSAALGLPIILAGGLTPENVAEAIETARPDAVDVAGGVESSPGRKDPAKVAKFVAEARKAFDRLR